MSNLNDEQVDLMIQEIKKNLYLRKDFIKTTFEIYITNNINSKINNDLIIDIDYFKDLLEEFEFTIKQSLQAIKTLEVENSNLKEIIHNKSDVPVPISVADSVPLSINTSVTKDVNTYQLKNEVKHLSIEYEQDHVENAESDIANYRFLSPTNSSVVYINNFTEMSFSPNKDRIEEDEDKNLKFANVKNEGLSYNFDQNFDTQSERDDKMNLAIKINDNNTFNEPINKNLIYQRNINYLSSFKTCSSPENKMKVLALNFDYSNIKEYKDMFKNNPNFKNFNGITEQEQVGPVGQVATAGAAAHVGSFSSIGLVGSVGAIGQVRSVGALSHLEQALSQKDISSVVSLTIENEYDLQNEPQPEKINISLPKVKQGFRKKMIKNKSNSSPSFHKSSEVNNYGEMKTSDNIETENNVPIINSKRDAFNNRLNEMEKEIIIPQILKKINHNEKVKANVIIKYANGSYQQFINKLKNNEISINELDQYINSLFGQKQLFDSKILINHEYNIKSIDNNSGGAGVINKITDKIDKKNAYYTINNNNNINSKKLNLNKKTSFNPDNKNKYTEPINFERFLRSSKPRINRENSRKRTTSRTKSKDRIKNNFM